jgi:riboflavin kinase/FMN adenylyltransferase
MNFTDFDLPSSPKPAWVTIGSFDGVHLGHQSLIKQLVEQAHAVGELAVVVTFWPHPATFFQRAPLAYALTSPVERRDLLTSLGVDGVLTLTFDKALANLDAEAFLGELREQVDMTRLLVGPNFALGKGRGGDAKTLVEIGKNMGFNVTVVEPLVSGGEMVSSSLIRLDLSASKVRKATEKLGRPYSLSGKIVHGEHRGTRLGVPTANLELLPERLIPANGVYATRAWLDGKTYIAATNIGVRPTFENPLPAPRVEPHLLDIQEHLYGQDLKLEFIEFLRPEVKFESSDALVAQIQLDIARTRQVFKHEK